MEGVEYVGDKYGRMRYNRRSYEELEVYYILEYGKSDSSWLGEIVGIYRFVGWWWFR